MNPLSYLHQPLALQNGDTLTMISAARYLPGRRLAGLATWHNQTVFAKVFFGKKAYQYARRDYQGLQHLSNAQILAPAVLWFGQVADFDAAQAGVSGAASAYVLILEQLAAHADIELAMKPTMQPDALRLQLADQLIITVANHHNVGLIQQDLFLKNFLWSRTNSQGASPDRQPSGHVEDQIFTLDGDGIKTFRTLSTARALDNLSLLLSKFDVLDVHQHLSRWLGLYAQTRRWPALPNVDAVWQSSQRIRLKVASQYAEQKVFRRCTDVPRYAKTALSLESKINDLAFKNTQCPPGVRRTVAHLLNGFLQTHCYLRREYLAYEAVINVPNLDLALTNPTFKSGHTCTVGRMAPANIDPTIDSRAPAAIVIKRYNIKSLWHAMGRSVRQTRAAISWANAHRLLLLGIPANLPVALLEVRYFFGLLASKSYFLSAYIDAPDASTFFAKTQDASLRTQAIEAFVNLFYRLYLLRISHGDLKATNIKVVDLCPILIDLDSMKQHQYAWFAKGRHARDLRRFMRNWQQDTALTQAFKQAFITQYDDHAPLKLAGILES